jgi:hypothetical protein
MTDGRSSQLGADVWAADATPKGEVSQLGADVYVAPNPKGKTSQLGADVWVTTTAEPVSAVVSQLGADVWVLPVIDERITLPRMTVDVVFRPPRPLVIDVVPAPINPHNTACEVIPSYLYQEYSDDDDLQAFVAAYNTMAQQYVEWFCEIGLPVYTGLSGLLLDWIAQGIYGISRPILPTGVFRNFGTYNSAPYNRFYYNEFNPNAPLNAHSGFQAVTDDIFQRIITWHFFKGDGKNFSISWLKRRIQRFLYGVNGTAPNIDQTYRISVVIDGTIVYINILTFFAISGTGFLYNRVTYNNKSRKPNTPPRPYNDFDTESELLPPIPMASVFKAAVDAKVLELPFGYTYVVGIT